MLQLPHYPVVWFVNYPVKCTNEEAASHFKEVWWVQVDVFFFKVACCQAHVNLVLSTEMWLFFPSLTLQRWSSDAQGVFLLALLSSTWAHKLIKTPCGHWLLWCSGGRELNTKRRQKVKGAKANFNFIFSPQRYCFYLVLFLYFMWRLSSSVDLLLWG